MPTPARRHGLLPLLLALALPAGADGDAPPCERRAAHDTFAPTFMDDDLPSSLADPEAAACTTTQCLLELQARRFRLSRAPTPAP